MTTSYGIVTGDPRKAGRDSCREKILQHPLTCSEGRIT